MDHMYVVLPSNSSMEYYPENTLANYKVKLGKPLHLRGQYEVALVEIIYPHRRLSIEAGEATMTVHTTESYITGKLVKQKKHKPKHLDTNKTKPYESKAELRQKEKDEIIEMTLEDPSVPVRDDVVMTYNEQEMKVRPKASMYRLDAEIFETISELLEKLKALPTNDVEFLQSDGKLVVKLKANVNYLEFSPRMTQLLGFNREPSPYLIIRRELAANYAPHLKGSAHSLYIYSSVVDHQLVGDTVAPLLRVVCPDEDKLGQTVAEKYIKPYYLPVNNSYIDTIDIQIRTTSGDLFPFLSGSPVVLNLHFRPRLNRNS